jgi:hypothetical protein
MPIKDQPNKVKLNLDFEVSTTLKIALKCLSNDSDKRNSPMN